jgi:branched-chain amino acid transport system permease protein
MVIYRLCFDRVKVHETAVLIISVAVGMIIQEIFLLIFLEHYRVNPPFFPGFIEIVGVRLQYQHLFTIATSILTLIAVWGLLSKTRLGKAIRAIDQDSEIANVMGIDVTRTSMKVMGISTILAGVAGISVGPIVTIHPLMWLQPLVTVLAAVVLGGLGSIKGSALAAFILGFAESTVVFLVPGGSFLRGAVSLAVMVVILLVRPEGLFGIAFEEERL